MKYYIIAGERSGDLHGAKLIKSIKKHDPKAEIRAWGGDMMQDAGAELVKHYRELAFMGIWEVLKNLFSIQKLLKYCKTDIQNFQPDAVILIDYAGFNMRIAQFAKNIGFYTFYYISPKVWAWNTKRALKIKQFVDKMFVILPFEKDFFKQFDYEVEYVGNPLIDDIEAFKPNLNFKTENQFGSKPLIALLPGSRKQEVEEILPTMVSVVPLFPDYQFVIAGVSNLPKAIYQDFDLPLVIDDAYNLLQNSEAALVTSGTATLETALLHIPQVVCYKTSWLTAFVGMKLLLKVPFISLVNLVAGKEVVKELIQDKCSTKIVSEELKKILLNSPEREMQLKDYQRITILMGDLGASERVGERIVFVVNSYQ